jgi:hypothetical protein
MHFRTRAGAPVCGLQRFVALLRVMSEQLALHQTNHLTGTALAHRFDARLTLLLIALNQLKDSSKDTFSNQPGDHLMQL